MVYQCNPSHRNNSPQKSQWTISTTDEIAIFNHSESQGWILEECGWGLHIFRDKPQWLGIAKDKIRKLFIAKFVRKLSSPWHGYPADHSRLAQDVPHEIIVSSWIDKQLISKAKARKILRGMKCSL